MWLHVVTGDGAAALATLAEAGYDVQPNSRGVLVEVSAQQKGRAVEVLQQAGVRIDDLEVWR